MDARRVVVVGAGPSGLTAAYRLRRAGCEVVVLDRGDRAGGKLRSDTEQGFVMDAGAAIVPSSYARFRALADELGVADRLRPCGMVMGFARDGQIHHLDPDHLLRDALRTRLLPTRAKAALGKLGWDAFRARKALSYDDLSGAAPYDTETAQAYTERRLGPEVFEYVVDSALRGLIGVSGETVSKVDLLFAVANVLAGRLSVFEGGTQTWADALAADLDVRTGATVHEVRPTPTGVVVDWTDTAGAPHTEDADSCVVAVAGTLVPGLVPELDPVCRDYLSELRYTSSVNCHIAVSEAPASPALMVQVPRAVHPGLSGIMLDHNKAPGRVPAGKGLISSYSTAEWAAELIEESDDLVAKHMVDAVEEIFPGIGGSVEFVRVHRWAQSAVYSRPGTYAGLAEFNRHRPHGPVHLAGDYFSTSTMEAAVRSGERAAAEILGE
jgi:oxygen-dependent protoporphyrinogen oxidase